MASGCRSQLAVEPSTSVNRKVTVPDGRTATGPVSPRSEHNAFGLALPELAGRGDAIARGVATRGARGAGVSVSGGPQFEGLAEPSR